MPLYNQRKMPTILSALISLTLISSCLAQVATVCETTHEYDYDSGRRRNAFTRVSFNDAGTIQLDLSQTKLAPGAKLILTGTRNDSYQELNDQSLQALNGWSDAIDGNKVTVELIGPTGNGNKKSRVVISGFKTDTCVGGDDVTSSSICGDVDDRIASQDVRAGRIGGCTGWLISEDVFIQAGHCGTPSSSTRIHFTYGVSNAPVQDQYAVDVSSYVGVNGGVGNDWGVGRLLPNSSTGKLPGVAQSEKCGSPGCGWYTLGTVPSSTSGNNIRVTGYGTAAVDSRSQKTHVGPLTSMTATALRYRPDTTGGNSGSPVIHEETGHAIGVHTHGGCSATGGSNAGTRIDRAEFAAAVDALLGGVSPTPAPTPACQQSDFQLNLLTDNYPSETTWTLTNNCSGGQIASGGPYSSSGTAYTETACVPAGEYTFTINDSYGDGICCGYGSGSYSIEYEGSTVVPNGGSFSSTISHTFGSCGNSPTNPPTSPPTLMPTIPTNPPTNPPTNLPTNPPTLMPTIPPTLALTSAPTPAPSPVPTSAPVTTPTVAPTSAPITAPTAAPTAAPVTPPTGGGWKVIYQDSFEADQGRFMGTNKRFSGFSYPDGDWSLRIRRTSQLKSEWIDFSPYLPLSQLSFKFWMYARSMEVGDNFFLSVRFDGETEYTLLGDYLSGTDFGNLEWVQKTVPIDIPPGKQRIQLLFKGDSDKGNDQVFIDQVLLEGN